MLAALGVAKENRAIDTAKVGVERLHGAVSHGRGHDLVLHLAGAELFAGSCKLDEVDFKGTGRYIRHFIGEALKLVAVGDDLEDGHVQLVQERGHLWRCNYAFGELGAT